MSKRSTKPIEKYNTHLLVQKNKLILRQEMPSKCQLFIMISSIHVITITADSECRVILKSDTPFT